jgi:7-cyano-7-deazaguanine synthase in queuosine biosynthesis
MKRCKKCALPEKYPGIDFDKKGICNYCNYLSASEKMRNSLRQNIEQQFYEIIKEAKSCSKEYDCVVCYSGGKDSTFLLIELQEKFNLKILAYTLDNGFMSKEAISNSRKITKRLDITHVIFKPKQNVVNKIFRDALTQKIVYPKELTAMLSPLCATCQGMIIAYAFRMALDKKIPIVFLGFTPGQYPDVSYENFLKSKSCIYFTDSVYKDDPPDIIKMIRDPIDEISGEEAGAYYLKSQYLKKGEKYPCVLFPFHTVFNYDEKKIYKKIECLGWVKPKDTDTCSTNCLINTLGNYAFVSQYGYHPYIAEISAMVRDGCLSLDDVLKLEKIDENSKAMKVSLQKLGLSKKDILI